MRLIINQLNYIAMKKNCYSILFRRLCAVLCALVWASPSTGQNVIYDQPNTLSEYTDIRNYQDGMDIRLDVYRNHQPRTFSYIDRVNGAVYTIPVSCNVYDFEICKGYVYFCGSRVEGPNQTTALFGWFNIDSVFFLTGDVHYEIVPFSSVNIYSFQRLAVSGDGQYIHLFLLGHWSSGAMAGDVVADAWKAPGSWSWNVEYSLDTTQTLKYQDIAVTDNYVVIVAGEVDNYVSPTVIQHCILSYPRPTASTLNQSMFGGTSIVTTLYATSPSIFTPGIGDEVHVVPRGNDEFATICSDIKGLEPPYPVVVSMYSDPLSAPYHRFSFMPYSSTRIYHAAFTPPERTLCMVSRNEKNVLYTTTYPFSFVEHIRIGESSRWQGVDGVQGTNCLIVSGNSSDYTNDRLCLYCPDADNCAERVRIDIEVLSRRQDRLQLAQNVRVISCVHLSEPVKVVRDRMNVICR